MFLVVSRSDVHFSIEDIFFTSPIGGESKIAHPKNRAARKKFVHSWIFNTKFSTEKNF